MCRRHGTRRGSAHLPPQAGTKPTLHVWCDGLESQDGTVWPKIIRIMTAG